MKNFRRGKTVRAKSGAEVVATLAAVIARQAEERITQAGSFHLALSGGSTPRDLYDRLVDPRVFPAAFWPMVHIWQVDERAVAAGDPQRNWGMIRSVLTDRVPLPADHLHPMPMEDPAADDRYDYEMKAALIKTSQRLDLVVLGMGEDGHTASLFPGTSALQQDARWVAWNDGDGVTAPRPRLTLTFPCLNLARQLAVLVTGAGKREILAEISAHQPDPRRWPITGVTGAGDSQVTWFVDEAADPPTP